MGSKPQRRPHDDARPISRVCCLRRRVPAGPRRMWRATRRSRARRSPPAAQGGRARHLPPPSAPPAPVPRRRRDSSRPCIRCHQVRDHRTYPRHARAMPAPRTRHPSQTMAYNPPAPCPRHARATVL
eukprot:gene2235-biopygen12490